MWKPSKFRADDIVEVRSVAEILATLDSKGQLDGLPFMPEMLEYCGKRIKIAAAAHKTCDPAHKTGARRLDRTVHLSGARCDGSAHGGCQAECNLFWKDAWLKMATNEVAAQHDAVSAIVLERLPTLQQERYVCQATELITASIQLPWWNVRQFFLDVISRNHSTGTVARVLLLSWSRQLLRIPLGYRFWVVVNDSIHRLLTGQIAPRVTGQVPSGQATPSGLLNLQPGEMVRIKSPSEIALTLDRNSKNRGMWFDAEQIEFCEKRYRVRRRVSRIINERTGQLMELKNPCITLEGVYCSGHHSTDRLLCPRAITPYWREIWLERADL